MPALAAPPKTVRERIAWQIDYMQEPIFIAGKLGKLGAMEGVVLSVPPIALYFYYNNKFKNAIEEKDKQYFEQRVKFFKIMSYSLMLGTALSAGISTLCWYNKR